MTAIGLMTVSLTVAGWQGQAAILTLAVLLAIAGAGIGWRDMARFSAVPLGFIATGTAAQMVSVGFTAGWPQIMIVPPEAIAQAGFIALRSAACVSALLFLAMTTPLSSLLIAGRRLGLRGEIADIALMMLRIVWLLLDCLDQGQRSQASRLGHSSLPRMIRSHALLLASLLPRVLSRAGRIHQGLAARGFDGTVRFLTNERRTTPARLGSIGGALLALALAAAWLP